MEVPVLEAFSTALAKGGGGRKRAGTAVLFPTWFHFLKEKKTGGLKIPANEKLPLSFFFFLRPNYWMYFRASKTAFVPL